MRVGSVAKVGEAFAVASLGFGETKKKDGRFVRLNSACARLRVLGSAAMEIAYLAMGRFDLFVHGALCISYSGQCYMSGMISERSANRGSCAQSCRKDYVLRDQASGAELDRGYLISAKDLGAWEHLAEISAAGVGCLKIEGRKKKPEFVATVTKGYREFLSRVETGTFAAPSFEEVQPLVRAPFLPR